MFISILYMFQAAMCPSSGKLIVSIWHLVYVTLYRWPFSVQVWMRLQSHPNLHTKTKSTGFWWGDNFEGLGLYRRVISKWIFKKWYGEAWTVLLWLRIVTGGGCWRMRYWAFGFH